MNADQGTGHTIKMEDAYRGVAAVLMKKNIVNRGD
jgi:hypothetical protein